MSGPVDSRPLPDDSGDAWVFSPEGRQYWGTYGAAGLLAHDPERGILLQHRVAWSHFGGTWALPGGARHRGESAVDGAFREAAEEAGVPQGAVRPRFTAVADLGFWSYTTVVADVIRPFEPEITDPESVELRWVPIEAVTELPLHPGFEAAWPALRADLERAETLVIDAANVVGSRPDGWWRDRPAAARRLLDRLSLLAAEGIPNHALGLGQRHWWPHLEVVLEGAARPAAPEGAVPGAETGLAPATERALSANNELSGVRGGEAGAGAAAAVLGATDPSAASTDAASASASASASEGSPLIDVRIRHAAGEGDDEIVDAVRELLGRRPEHTVWVVTSDRGLQERVTALGARTLGSGWLWARLDELEGREDRAPGGIPGA